MLIFWLGLIVLFIALPCWVMKHLMNMLEIRNGAYRKFLYVMAIWATWDYFQTDPVIWYSRQQWPDQHGNHQIEFMIFMLVAGRYLWVLTRHWWAAPPRSIRAHDTGMEVAAAFANTPLFSASARRSADPAAGPVTRH